MPKPTSNSKPSKLDKSTAYEVRPEQSVDLLKALHVRISRVVYSLIDKSSIEVSHKELSYSTTYGV